MSFFGGWKRGEDSEWGREEKKGKLKKRGSKQIEEWARKIERWKENQNSKSVRMPNRIVGGWSMSFGNT